MRIGETIRLVSDRDQGGSGRRQTVGNAAHSSNPWHNPWCRQGRREDRDSMLCLLGQKQVATQQVPPSQIAMGKAPAMVLDVKAEHGTAHYHRHTWHFQTTPPPTKARIILGGAACLIHATRPRLGTTDCVSSLGPHHVGPVLLGLGWVGTASPRDSLGPGQCVAQQSLQCGCGRIVPRHARSPTPCEQKQALPTSAKIRAALCGSMGTRVVDGAASTPKPPMYSQGSTTDCRT